MTNSEPTQHPERASEPRRAGAFLILLAVLLAFVSFREQRQRRTPSADAPTANVVAAMPTEASMSPGPSEGTTVGTSAPAGRILFRCCPDRDDKVLAALNPQTGAIAELWPVVNVWQPEAVAADGSGVAYRSEPYPPTGAEELYVRLLVPGSEPVRVSALPPRGKILGVAWTEPSVLLYGVMVVPADAFGQNWSPETWELHRVDLRREGDRLVAGEPEVVWSSRGTELEPEILQLLTWEPTSRHAALVLGLGENASATGVAVVKVDTGDLTVFPMLTAESLRHRPAPDGRWVAAVAADSSQESYWDRLRLRIVDVASASEVEVGGAIPEFHWSNHLLWTGDSRSVVWSAVPRDTSTSPVVWMVTHMDDPLSSQPLASPADPVASAPGSRIVLETGEALDVRTGTSSLVSTGNLTATTLLDPSAWLHWLPAEPTGSDEPPATVQPVATAGALDFDGWSPDGRWLTFWASDEARTTSGPVSATLHFLDVETGEQCTVPETADRPHRVQGLDDGTNLDTVFWEPDGRASVRIDGIVLEGRPCDSFAAAPASRHSLPTAAPGETPAWAYPQSHGYDPAPTELGPSPSGRYHGFHEDVTQGNDGVEHHITRIMSADGRETARVEWTIGARLGGNARGGTWLPDDRLLVAETIERGPLILEPDGQVLEVVPELFGLELPAAESPGHQVYAVVTPLVGQPGDGYHLLLSYVGIESDNPPLALYHSETGRSEQLPAGQVRSIDVAGRGIHLLLTAGSQAPPQGDRADRYSARPLDPPGVEPVRLPIDTTDPHDVVSSPDGHLLAVAYSVPGPRAAIVRFPDGETVDAWALGEWQASQLLWSPDSSSLAVTAMRYGEGRSPNEWALFVVQP